MVMRSPTSFGVGEMLFSSEFQITPRERSSWELAQVLGDRDDRPSFRPQLEQPPAGGGAVPEGLLIARAVEAVERSSNLGGCVLTPTSVRRLRVHGPIGVGERLTAVATVRYRSVLAGHAFLTLAVDVRGGGHKLAELEVGVEVSRRREPTLPAAA